MTLLALLGALGCAQGSGSGHAPQAQEPDTACGAGFFTCDSGTCIAEAGVCNGVDECGDGSDELSCTGTDPGAGSGSGSVPGASAICYIGQLDCGDGTCVDANDICDGFSDCPGTDPADERGCGGATQECGYGFFTCGPGSCVPVSQRCDGEAQCGNASDEAGCGSQTGGGDGGDEPPPPPPPACDASTQFTCGDASCISADKVCNQTADCSDGSDEQGCGCDPAQSFACGDGSCLPWSKYCDGVADCPGGGDESQAACSVNTECGFDQFECNDHQCLPLFFRCDGETDCSYGEDELSC